MSAAAQPDGARVRRPLTPRLCAAAATALGVVALVGWALEIEVLKCVYPGLISMKLNAALGFILAGAAFLTIREDRPRNRTATVLAALAITIGVLTLFEYLTRIDLGIDQALVREPSTARFSLSLGRMHPTTAFDFVLLGVTTILLASDRGYRTAHALALIAALIAGTALIAYAYGIRQFVGMAVYNQMALHTTLGMLALSVAALTSRPGRGLMAMLTGDSPGSQIARRLLPVAILLPFTLNGLTLWSSHARLFDERFATAVRVSANIAIFVGCILWNAHSMQRADRERRRTEDRYRFMAEAMPLIVWTAAPEGTVDYYNRRWYDFTGMSVEECNRRGWEPVLHPEDLGRARDSWALAVRTGVGFEIEYRFRRGDDSYRWHLCRAEPMRDAAGRAVRWFGTCIEIHDQKLAGEQRFRSLVEATTAIVWSAPASGQFEWDQPGWSAFTGQGFDQLKGWGWLDAIHPDDREETARTWSEAVSARLLFQVEHRLRRHDGEYRHMVVRAVPVLSGGGATCEWVGAHTDVDIQKRAEAALREAKEAAEAGTRAKGEFLANMSHEIRTPMNGVIGMLDLTLRSSLRTRQREFLTLAKSSAETLLRLLNDILDFSKIEAGRLELESTPFPLREVVSDTLKTLALPVHEKGLELTHSVAPDVPDAVLGDPGRLSQILVNLVGNAQKFTARGEVAVRVELGSRTEDTAELHFSVRDTGIGIAPEKHAQIFAPFTQADSSTTREFGGTGLGLTICAHLVQAMGGRIWVESVVGRGSTFHFIARMGLQEEAGTARPVPGRVNLDGLPVLVVDDNATHRLIIEQLVASWGMKPMAVDGGPAAIEAMRHAREAGEPYSLVLLDVLMPGMDGFEVAEWIQRDAKLAGTAIMMLSSADHSGDAGRCKAVGAAAFLRKPIKESELFNTILEVLGLATPARAGSPSADMPTLPPPSVRLRILLAEDTPVNQRLAVMLLEDRGHAVVVASDGREALDILERESFDLILMDVQMPRMDGFEATAAIRAGEAGTDRRMPILAMTAHAMKGDRERCLAAGMDGYISKPIRAEQFLALVEGRFPTAERPEPERSRGPGVDVAALVFDLPEALARARGKWPLLRRMAELFVADCPGLLDQIRAALATADAPMLERAAHRLKGSAANLSAPRVVAVAGRLEEIGRAGALAGADATCAELEDEIVRLGRALETLREEGAPCGS